MPNRRESISDCFVRNYFNYFTEIEEHFQRRRGTLLLLSTIDWALIDTWREAGVPLTAVLAGIDNAFEKYEVRKSKGRVRQINGLAYCAQEVIAAVEDMKEAATGSAPAGAGPEDRPRGFETERVAAHLERCAAQIGASQRSTAAGEIAERLHGLAGEIRSLPPDLEDLEAKLAALDEKLFAIAVATTPETEILVLRQQAGSELAPYRSRMQALQIRQVERQFLHKRLFEKLSLPRLSLFYMSQS